MPNSDGSADISFVIVTKDRWELLRNVVDFLQRYNHCYNDIVVVDNGSSSSVPKSIKSNPNINLIKLPSNVGVSEGRNIGAVNAEGDLLCFVDDDGYLDMSYMAELQNEFKDSENLAAISFKISNIDHMPDPSKVTFENNDRQLSFEPSYSFQGGACLIEKEAFIQSGMYPEDFHYGTEERDLSIRLIDNSYSIVRTEDVTFLHYNPHKAMDSEIFNPYHYYRNKIRHYWRTYPLESAIIETILKIPSAILRSRSSTDSRDYFRGLAAGLSLIPHTVKHDRSPVNRKSLIQQKKLEDRSWVKRITSILRNII